MVQYSKELRDDRNKFDPDYWEFLEAQRVKDEEARNNGEFKGEKEN